MNDGLGKDTLSIQDTVGRLLIEELLPWPEKIPDEIHLYKNDLERRAD